MKRPVYNSTIKILTLLLQHVSTLISCKWRRTWRSD